jgi:hypothetical protein
MSAVSSAATTIVLNGCAVPAIAVGPGRRRPRTHHGRVNAPDARAWASATAPGSAPPRNQPRAVPTCNPPRRRRTKPKRRGGDCSRATRLARHALWPTSQCGAVSDQRLSVGLPIRCRCLVPEHHCPQIIEGPQERYGSTALASCAAPATLLGQREPCSARSVHPTRVNLSSRLNRVIY